MSDPSVTSESSGSSLAETCKWSFRLELFSQEQALSSLWLPARADGFLKFPDGICPFLSVESQEDRWVLCCAGPAFFADVALDQFNRIPLQGDRMVTVEYEGIRYFLFAEAVSRARLTYSTYALHSETEIRIGNTLDCDLYFRSQNIYREICTLRRKDRQWSFSCSDADCPVFVNGIRKNGGVLYIGDFLYILGLHVIIGPKHISINDGEGAAFLNPRFIKTSSHHHRSYGYESYGGLNTENESQDYFNRRPRKFEHWEQEPIVVEAPPLSLNSDRIPLVLRMGSSMVMSGRAAMMGNFTTMISSVLFPLLSNKFGEKQKQEYEARRVTQYTEYLDLRKKALLQACADQQAAENRMLPTVDEILAAAVDGSGIWERRPADGDFLTLRLGSADRPCSTQIDYPQRHFDLETDVLEERMYDLVEAPRIMHQVPAALSLIKDRVTGLMGPRAAVLELVFQILMQIVVCHSYDEVKLIFLADPREAELFQSLRFLPHLWDDRQSTRFFATCDTEASALSEYFKKLLPDENSASWKSQNSCHYVVIALSKSVFNSAEVLKTILHEERNRDFSFLAVMDDLPRECTKVITLSEDGNHLIQAMQKSTDPDEYFTLDSFSRSRAFRILRRLSNLSLKAIAMEQELPKMLTFLDLFQVGKVEHLNVLKRWSENSPVRSLAAPIGVHADGSPFTLDLHEKRQGPHGLVAGMTGSGKSEFIITYILSMAVNYHPDEVSFILIDYKGGGLAGAFDNPRTGLRLPHLAGTITNLDGAEIDRSLISIESELLRRQRLLNEVKNTVNEGTLDIYGYQKLYRQGKVKEPLPHLFIISDEFAELKAQRPEFMEKLISAARIGRSLGVHLILATQKPAGVVDDQIRSNTKFRICLRVQERSDSMDMLKRGEAAELRDTGRFYLQVGYNEYFSMGQSAWCGAPYAETDRVQVRKDDEIEFLTATGQTLAKTRPAAEVRQTDRKQIVAVVEYLNRAAESIGFRPKPLWKPPLPGKIAWRDPEGLSPFALCPGILDDPQNQQQYVMHLDLARCQHLLIMGTPGTGKSVLVSSMLRSLVLRNSPEDLQFYILDFSSRTLKQFAKLPHCGACLQEEDSQSFESFFKLMKKVISQRKKLFSKLGVDQFTAARQLTPLPLVLVVIDNLPGLGTTKVGDNILYSFSQYLKGSANYGVQFILTGANPGEIPGRIRQEIGNQICLHMKDKYAYSEILNCRVDHVPPEKPGRGLFCREGRPLEMQLAMFEPSASPKVRREHLQKELEEVCRKYRNAPTILHLPVQSETATYQEFSAQFDRFRIPLGFSLTTKKPVALPLRQFTGLSLYLGNPAGRVPVCENLLHAAKRENMTVFIHPQAADSCFREDSTESVDPELMSDAKRLSPGSGGALELLAWLKEELPRRKKLLQEYLTAEGLDPQNCDDLSLTFPYMTRQLSPVWILMEHFSEFCQGLDLLSGLQLCTYLNSCHLRHIYPVALFHPDDPDIRSLNSLYSGFNAQGNLMLFGGALDRQPIYEFLEPPETGLLPYNSLIMHYDQKLYPMIMPCGELQMPETDPDTRSIF